MRPLGRVACSLEAELLLLLQRGVFVLGRLHTRQRNSELVGRQRLEDETLDFRVDPVRPHELALAPLWLTAQMRAHVHRILAARSRVVQLHARAASSADGDSLQERITAAGRARPTFGVQVLIAFESVGRQNLSRVQAARS